MDSNRPVALDPLLGDPELPASAGVPLIRCNLPAAISILNASTNSAAGTGIHLGRALAAQSTGTAITSSMPRYPLPKLLVFNRLLPQMLEARVELVVIGGVCEVCIRAF